MPSATVVGGSCEQWMAQAGVNDLASARELIRRESGCNLMRLIVLVELVALPRATLWKIRVVG